MTGFADLLRERGDACERPARGDRDGGAGDTPPPTTAAASDSPFLAGLRPETRQRVLGRISRRSDALDASQDDLDQMTDEEKWQWARDAITAEHTRAAQAAQTTLEGHR